MSPNSYARILATSYALPLEKLTNDDLSEKFPEWSAEKIGAKTGIVERRIAGVDEYSSTLAIRAGENLFREFGLEAGRLDYIIMCTQSPDFYLPTTASIVHDALGMRNDSGATDINLGCSGFVYGLSLAKGLIESDQVQSVLLITADTYSKFLNPEDRGVRTVFGDGASATLIEGGSADPALEAFEFGSDGSGASNLIVPSGGLRPGETFAPSSSLAERGLDFSGYDLYMDGPAIFRFTLDVVPRTVERVLGKAGLTLEQVDLFVFHQANQFMLDHVREKIGVPDEKFFVDLSTRGNTVSSTIPIALTEARRRGLLRAGMIIMVVGFGVGYSWAGGIIRWQEDPV